MAADGDRWWARARQRAEAEVLSRSVSEHWPRERYWRSMEYIRSPQWVPPRGERKLPSKWTIASYWAQRDDWFDVDLERPHCFACGLHGGWPEDEPDLMTRWDAAKRLQRGHIINRARHGLDGVQNLIPLCGFCNRFMRIYSIGQEDEALAWILSGGAVGEMERRTGTRQSGDRIFPASTT